MDLDTSPPDDGFADAERLARESGRSASRPYRDAVREYVSRHAAGRVTETLDVLFEELDPGTQAASTAPLSSCGQTNARRFTRDG